MRPVWAAIVGTALALSGCAGPRSLDTGSPLTAGPHAEPDLLWARDLGRALEFPPVAVGESWLAVVTEGPLHRLRRADGKDLWRCKLPGPATGAPAVCAGVAAIGTESPGDRLVGVSLDTGRILWKVAARGALPAGRDSLLVAAGRGGWAARFAPHAGEEIWRVGLVGAGWRTPVVRPEENLVLVPVRPDSVAALCLADGARRWTARAGRWARLSENEVGPVAAAGDDSTLILLDPATGRITARRDLGAMPGGAPVVTGDLVVIALRNGWLLALGLSDLATVWSRALGPPLVSAPVVSGATVAQAGPRGLVHLVDVADGALLVTHEHPEKLMSSGAWAPDQLVMGGARGTLVAYRRRP